MRGWSARPGAVVVAGLLLALGTVVAVSMSGPGRSLTDRQLADQIAATLRCPVCKDLSAADSPAPLARQMRAQIRRQVAAGATPDEIRQRFVTAYGSSVLIAPPDQGWGRALRLAPWALLAGGVLAGGLFLRRAVRRGTRGAPASAAGDETSLGRQLEDLDEDRLAGRVDEEEYHELRADLAAKMVEAMRARHPARPAATRAVRPADRSGPDRPSRHGRVLRWSVGVSLATGASVGVVVLLVGAVDPRPAASATGGTPAQAASSRDRAGAAAAAGGDALTADQLAAVERAVELVRKTPRRAAAHVELARAYTAAQQPQLAAVEYLAAARLDPDNPEANTALALVAFQAGSARRAEALATKALQGRPGYPEALYTRGLIRAMGLRHPDAARRDLRAYLRVAPFGSHRTSVVTVLALLKSGAIR